MIGIVIVGVGGQGTLLASKILGKLALKNGYDVKVSEVHGMSQRGGSVITHVRMSKDEKVYSPLVEQQGADVVVAFERLEALRAVPYLKKGGKMIVNEQMILPMPVITGAQKYPDDILNRLKQEADTISLDALAIAEKCGNLRSANLVLLGVLARQLPFSQEDWLWAIEECVPAHTVEINKSAFLAGYALA